MNAPLDALRDVESADVYKAGRLAARIRRTLEAVEFVYDPAYLTDEGPAVAVTLPALPEPVRTHAPGALPPFFAGLLPEGRRLTALRLALKTSADDEFSLLLAVGGDAIGDVQVVPQGETPREAEPRVAVASWDQVRFADLFAEALGRSEIDRVGLPGVQDKVSARMITLPVAQRDARYILKLDPPEYPFLVENEAFFLDAAARSGVPAASAEVVRDADGRAGLLVQRFDRVPAGDGTVVLRAQEDGCQVLGRYPADKYRVTSEDVVRALSSVTRARPVAARDLLRQLAFAYLTCNGDAHAKNFSIVRDAGDGEWKVSPAYDVPTSHPYGDNTLALPIAGRRAEDIGRESFVALGESVGVRPRATHHVLEQLVDTCSSWLDRLAELPFDERRIHKLRRVIEYRRDRLGTH